MKYLSIVYGLFFYSALFNSICFSEEMNGISFEKLKGFDQKWKLINVRYRKDTEEIRLIYANPKAYKAITKKTKFPEGAILGKIAYKTIEDKAFPSSIMPSQNRRFQFMVYNSKKYKNYNNWGYALFDHEGKPFKENHQTQTEACVACHNIVPERQYVFSWPSNSSVSISDVKFHFTSILVSQLPLTISKHIPNGFTEIEGLSGNLQNKLFFGTLDEIRPILARQAYSTKRPTALISADFQQFEILYVENPNENCSEKNNVIGKFMTAIKGQGNQIDISHFCQENDVNNTNSSTEN